MDDGNHNNGDYYYPVVRGSKTGINTVEVGPHYYTLKTVMKRDEIL